MEPQFKITYLMNRSLMILFVLIFFSCTKEKDKTSDTENWEMIMGVIKTEFKFTDKTYQSDVYYKLSGGNYYKYSNSSGDKKMSADTIEFSMNMVRIDTTFVNTYSPSGIMTEFVKGTDEFDKFFKNTAISKYKYEISGDTMYIWVDGSAVEYIRKY